MGNRFENSQLQQWTEREKSPAAPRGAQVAAEAAGDFRGGGGRFENSQLGKWTAEKGMFATAQKWYSGANPDGVNNGWDNDFVDRFVKGQEKAAAEGRLGSYFAQPDATGVVTWDHKSEDGRYSYEFGDIFENGAKVGNVFEQFDKDTANLMMADWLFDGKTKAEIYGDSDVKTRLAREVESKREQNNVNIPKALSAKEFAGKVEKRSDEFQAGAVDEAAAGGAGILGAVLAGGAAGAVTGAPTGPGAILTAIGGGLLAGGAAWMNRDELADSAARAYEITAMSSRENGRAAGIFTGVQEWAGFGSRLISPLSNTVHGLDDQLAGNAGDGESQFYKVDKHGERTAPKLLRVADVAATVGDSLLQFASPAGLALYSTQMSGVIGGEVGSMTASGGKVFDDRSGSFDNTFRDDQGNLDLASGAAGIGKVAIDAVQMGMARGLARKTDSAIAAVGGDAAYGGTANLLGKVSRGVTDRLPRWAGGQSDALAAKATLEAGGKRVERGGFEYVVDAAGKAVSRRPTLTLLAPSEQLSGLSTGMMARRAATAARADAVRADDFYVAAQKLAAGEKKWTTVVVNAMGEGYEEGVQAILEPWSHNASVDGEAVLEAAAYGAAAGAGMGLGTSWKAPTSDEKLFSMAQVGQMLRTGGVELTRDAWSGMSDTEKRSLAAMGGMEQSLAEATYKKIAADQAAEQVAGVAGIAKVHDAVQSELSKNLSRLTDRTDGAFVITQLEDAGELDNDGNPLPTTMPAYGIGSSALQLAANLTNHHRGITIQLGSLKRDLAEANTALAADPNDEAAAGRVEDLTRKVAETELVLDWASKFDAELDIHLDRLNDPAATRDTIEAETVVLNSKLRRAFHMQVEDYLGTALTRDDKVALARAVSMVFARDPHDQAGSYQMLLPQASAKLTAERADNILEVSGSVLSALSGDYDGDKLRPQNQLVLDETEFINARSGTHFLGAGAHVNVAAPKYEKYIVDYLAQALASPSTALRSYADETLLQIATAIRHRYDGLGIDSVLDEVFESFFDAVKAGSKDARETLLDGLAAKAGGPLSSFARQNLSNEWLWIDQLIRSTMQNFQETYAAHRPTLGDAPDATGAPRVRQTSEVRERKATRAATLGQSLAQFLPGDSLFRKFQKLHYSVITSPVLSSEKLTPSTLSEMALLYESLGQGLTRTELEAIRAKDEISGKVFAQLLRLARDAQKQLDPRLNPFEAVSVVANLKVLDIYDDQGNVVEGGKTISLAQLLLKRAVQADRREKAAIFETSPELQAKHARLLAMTRPGQKGKPGRSVNAERAFVEVVGAQQMFTLLGDDASIFGPHLTVEQFLRDYVSKSETDRRGIDQQLRTEAAYLGREGNHNIPYDLDEVAGEGKISAYRSVVDAILAVGHNRITIDKHGTLHGEIAERSDRTSTDFQKAHAQVRAALQEFAGLSPRRDGELTTEMVQRLMESNPDFARQVMNLIPNASANAVLEVRDGEVYAANWLYTMFTMKSAKQAEVHYWRNLLLAEWNALGGRSLLATEETDDGQHGREFGRLPRRMHRVLYRLGKAGDGGLLLRKFLDTMESATDLDEFLRWVNTTPGIRGQQAPLTAWVDDTAEFDPDKAQGGWTTALVGAELREAISQLRTGTSRLVTDLAEERAALNADVGVLQAVRRVLRKDSGEDVTLDAGDRELHDQFVKAIEQAGELAVGLGPQAMLYQTVGAVRGFYPQAHTKGKNPDNVEPAGAFDALRDAFDYTTNYERMLASLTAVNLDAVGGNLGEIAKDGVRSMDDEGRPVLQARPSTEQMLDLLERADTRPLARAILFPQVMERGIDGNLRPQLLVGKSLKSLLNGTSHRDLFARDGRLSQDSALRYVAMVEAVARNHGGHFSVQRMVNDLVIARTSHADHVLSSAELEEMALQAYHDVAVVLQASGSIAADVSQNLPGTDPLAPVLEEVRKARRVVRSAGMLGLKKAEAEYTDVVLDQFILEREAELTAELSALTDLDRGTKDPGEKQRIARHIAAAQDDFDTFKAKVELLRTDDLVASVVQMFSITGDATEQTAKKQALVNYVETHLSMLQRVPAVKETLTKLTQQLLDSGRYGQPDLKDSEWSELSRAVIGVHLNDVVSLGGAGISVTPFPDMDDEASAANARYFDTTYGYLAEPLLSVDSPLVKAARDIHRRAGRWGIVSTDAELIDTLGRTLYREHSLGPWTADIPTASMEANQRLDSAAAAAAIAMAGNSPKRQAVISAATRRTFQLPGEELLSTTTLTGRDLMRPLDDEVMVQLPGATGPTHRPLAQLNNRFARSVTLRTPTGETVDLMAEFPDVGRSWNGRVDVAGGPYREIHLERIQYAVDTHARAAGYDPNKAQIDVEFFHPDSQPDGAEWFNNLFFEGTSFKLDADRHESLNSTLWFAFSSISQDSQRAALDASKLGKPALQVIETSSFEDREADETNAHVDLAEVLRRKTARIMAKDLGSGRLDPEFYNAVYKDLKLRHFFRGTADDGTETLWPAERVIAWQQAHPAEPLPLGNAELWVPTDDVLRSMLGEIGTQGVARVFEDQLEIDLSKVPTYTGVSEKMLERFRQGITSGPTELAQTRVANRARQSQLVVRTRLDEASQSAYDAKMQYFRARADEIHGDRATMLRNDDGGFNPSRNLAQALAAGDKMLRAENIAFDWSRAGVPFIGPRKPGDTALSKMLLHELHAALEGDGGYRTGWVYREGSPAVAAKGELSEVNLGGKRGGGMRVAPGDLVVVELDSFNGDVDLARKRIDHLANQGAVVVLGATDGQADVRVEVGEHLEANGYERLVGSGHVYRPIETASRFQNQKARESDLTEMRGVSAKSRLAVFSTRGLAIQEGAAWVNPRNERLGGIAVVMNLVPTDFLAGFNVPVEQFEDTSQVERVKAHLRGLDHPEGRALLRDMAGIRTDAEALEFDAAYQRMLDRFDANPGTVLPVAGDEFGTGDMIPLVDGRGKVLLYRHGYKAPDRFKVNEMLARTVPGKLDGAGVAVFPAKREPAATVHTGTVVRFRPRSGYGLSVELNIDLQVFGDKKQLEWNGMKYILAPTPDSVVLPDHGFFENGWGLDIVSDLPTALSKESLGDMVDNHRNAFAYFGIDFLPDVTEFFFPGQRNDQNAQRKARELLHSIATRAPRIQVAAADELLNGVRLPSSFIELLPQFTTEQGGTAWMQRLSDSTSVESQIATAMIVYLTTPGARVSDVLASGGFNNDDSNSAERQSVLMPRLFTQVFDNAPLNSELRIEINRRLNSQLYNPKGDGTGYRLLRDFTFQVLNADPRKNMEGVLQFAEAHSSGDNPLKNGMSFDESEKAAVSAHSAAIAYQAIGADTAFKYDLSKARLFAEGKGVRRFQRDQVDGGVWRMLTDTPAKDRSYETWRRETPAEAARRDLARDAVVQFRQPIKTDDESGWNDQQRKEYLDLAQQIVRHLGLQDAQVGVVDGWVRQLLGMPYGLNEAGEELGRVSGKGATEAAREILWNVEHHYLPTVGAEVPMLHVHDLQMIYRANRANPSGWRPRESMAPDSEVVSNWDDWVMVSIGSSLLTNDLFDPLYLLATDGFMHSYQNATRSLLDLPVSVDALVARSMLDPEVNDLAQLIDPKTGEMRVSLDPATELLAKDPVILDAARASLNELLGGQRIAGKFKGRAAPASEVARRREKRRKWRKENGVPVPVDVTMRNFRKNGMEAVDTGTTTNALIRSLIDLRVGTALINPALYVSMGPEQWVRGVLDRAANLLTGQSTVGATAALAAKAGLSHYTPEQLGDLKKLYNVLGQRHDFKAMVFRDLMYLRPHAPGIGRVERWLENYAKFGARMQDPTWGMRGNTLARRYVEAAMQHIEALPTENIISVDQLTAELMTNPQFLKESFPEAHQAGSNAVAQLRSLKATPISLALRGIYEPLSESSNAAVNMLSNLVLKIPMLFSGYAMNVATTITGLQGLSDMTAMFLEGRPKGTLIGRMQAAMRGEDFKPEDDAAFDMSSVLEGIDLSRSFIRGGLTHTALFSFGLMAGGLGLSGEDEETKRRRRAAELQGAGFIYDPRRIENDFRNADAIFLDWLPKWGPWYKVTGADDVGGARSMGELHWMMKQFLSPIIGMERFFNTGDFRQVTWGFMDALGAFPLVNTMMWNDAVETANELADMANEKARLGGPDNLISAGHFLTSAVGVYERMLFENSFVNSLYTSLDKYDRDPYAVLAHNEDGSLRTDALGNPEEAQVLQPYVDAQGNVHEGYTAREGASLTLHQLTENRATLATVATVMSLFTGTGDSDYFRRQMAIKTRFMEKKPMDRELAEAILRAAMQGQGGAPQLNAGELSQMWKNEAKAAGKFVDWGKLDAAAVAMVGRDGERGKNNLEPMSVLSKHDREVLTAAGAQAVITGLAKGTMKMNDARLSGIHIPFEMREQIQKDWMKQLVQEGIDLGLDETKAQSRMKRLWYGPSSDPTIMGLGDLLWSKDISYSEKVEYNQLNTTYVIGPDSMPWATGATRDGLLGALGLKPVKRFYVSEYLADGSLNAVGVDARLNTVDYVNRMNTGLRALELKPDAHIPTDQEIADSIIKAIEEAGRESYAPFSPYASSGGGSGWRNFGRRRYGGGGYRRRGYSGGGGGGYADFEKMYALPESKAPYGDSIPFINTSNPIIRRADVRRERVWSERGRLKQWQ